MAIVIDVTGLTAPDYRFAVSPLAELSAVLHVIAQPQHHSAQRDLLAGAADAMPGELARGLRGFDYLFRTSRADFFLPHAPAGTLAAELDAVDRLDDESWVAAALLTSSCGTFPVVAASPLTSPAARRTAVERAEACGRRAVEFVSAVLASPATARAGLRGLLEESARAFFDAMWADLGPRLSAHARRKRDLFATAKGPLPVHAVTSALHLEGDRIVVDKALDSRTSATADGLTLLPTIFGAPHICVTHAAGSKPVIQYPAAAEFGAPGLNVLQRRLHALDNPIRYRLARSLARADRTTVELAHLWALTSAEVSRHLAVLKDAGLVRGRREGRRVVYSLDQRALLNLGTDLTSAFLR